MADERSCNNPSGVIRILPARTLKLNGVWSLRAASRRPCEGRRAGGPLGGSNPRKNRGLEVQTGARKDNKHTGRIIACPAARAFGAGVKCRVSVSFLPCLPVTTGQGRGPRDRSRGPRDRSRGPRDRSRGPRDRSRGPRDRSRGPGPDPGDPRTGPGVPGTVRLELNQCCS